MLAHNLVVLIVCLSTAQSYQTEDFETFVSPEDLKWLSKVAKNKTVYRGDLNVHPNSSTTPQGHWIGNRYWSEEVLENDGGVQPSDDVDCFGLGSFMNTIKWFLDFRPLPSEDIYTRFYLTTRKFSKRVEIPSGDQFGLEWTDFDPAKRTIIIIHGFMSHSNASWVRQLSEAFLVWKDVNVLTVDWSRGGQTWKYWRAVANTRTVGTDVSNFLVRMMAATGCSTDDFHFVGHSLGAHICSFTASRLGGVGRITGLDPAQPCFRTDNKDMLLDPTDAKYVDVIHTNGRLMSKIGFGLPDPSGHADFYPNGGMKQPGCFKDVQKSIFYKYIPISPERLYQAICSHGRAYVLFTESLVNRNCSFIGYRWNMSYRGINSSVTSQCDLFPTKLGNCGRMGIQAYSDAIKERSFGQFYVVTEEQSPFCSLKQAKHEGRHYLVSDLLEGHSLNTLRRNNPTELQTINSNGNSSLTTSKPSGWWLFG